MYTRHDRGLKNSVDWVLVICYLLLVLFGWINIYASIHTGDASNILEFGTRSGKQFIWMITSLGIAVIVLFAVNPRLWEVISSPLYFLVLALLIAVIVVGSDVKGSHSWFVLGPISFQPAEISKISTSLMLAMIMSQQNFKLSNIKSAVLAIGTAVVPMLVIVAEKETGSALVYLGFLFAFYREGMTGWVLFMGLMAILLFILTLTSPTIVPFIVLAVAIIIFFVASNSGWAKDKHKKGKLLFSAASAIAGVLLIFSTEFVFNNILQDHQRSRIEVLLGLKEDPMGVGYNVNQSMIAIGSGGFAGKGFLNGTQTAFGFVPEQSTDFIFCTVGEEWGFLGCLFVIALYLILILRIGHDAEQSRDSFTRIYGYCVASCFFMHMFINIGMTIGLIPVIGIPLPFMSYGGSSLLGFTLMLFIFIALYRHEKRYF